MGIALDNRIYDSPRIQSPLGNPFQITNVGSLDNAKNLAITLTGPYQCRCKWQECRR
jgi:preprotein translocase subunit SecD